MTNRKVIIACGSRRWEDAEQIAAEIEKLPEGSVVISGGAAGADTFAHKAARKRNLVPIRIDACWEAHGKKAGPIRNRQMSLLAGILASIHSVDPEVWAFRAEGTSTGTDNMIEGAKEQGWKVRVIRERLPGEEWG